MHTLNKLRWTVCAGYAGLIAWLSLTPASVFNGVSSAFPQADKAAHFLMYGVLSWLIRWAMSGSGWGWRGRGRWVPWVALGYGALMEGAQSLIVPADRYFEVGDMVANGAGAMVFWSIAEWWQKCRRQTAAKGEVADSAAVVGPPAVAELDS